MRCSNGSDLTGPGVLRPGLPLTLLASRIRRPGVEPFIPGQILRRRNRGGHSRLVNEDEGHRYEYAVTLDLAGVEANPYGKLA